MLKFEDLIHILTNLKKVYSLQRRHQLLLHLSQLVASNCFLEMYGDDPELIELLYEAVALAWNMGFLLAYRNGEIDLFNDMAQEIIWQLKRIEELGYFHVFQETEQIMIYLMCQIKKNDEQAIDLKKPTEKGTDTIP